MLLFCICGYDYVLEVLKEPEISCIVLLLKGGFGTNLVKVLYIGQYFMI